jgi:hypothetical protein
MNINPLTIFEKLIETEDEISAVTSAFNFINKSLNITSIKTSIVETFAASVLVTNF